MTATKTLKVTARTIAQGEFDWACRPIPDCVPLLKRIARTHDAMCWGFHKAMASEFFGRFTACNNRIKRDDGKSVSYSRTWVYLTVSGMDLFAITFVPVGGHRVLRQEHDIHLDGLVDHLNAILEFGQ